MLNFADVFTSAGLATLGQVILIDLTMAGDNVVVLGTVAARVPEHQRKKVLTIGIAVTLVFLIAFALVATQLLHIIGLLFAGGLLLLWVCWRLFRELHPPQTGVDDPATEAIEGPPPRSFKQAVIQIVLADLSMSLDNVLAVAGTARDHPTVLFFGLAFTVIVMAVAASYIARLVERYHWLGYIGLIVILYVSGSMLYEGWTDPEIGLGRLFAHLA